MKRGKFQSDEKRNYRKREQGFLSRTYLHFLTIPGFLFFVKMAIKNNMVINFGIRWDLYQTKSGLLLKQSNCITDGFGVVLDHKLHVLNLKERNTYSDNKRYFYKENCLYLNNYHYQYQFKEV